MMFRSIKLDPIDVFFLHKKVGVGDVTIANLFLSRFLNNFSPY